MTEAREQPAAFGSPLDRARRLYEQRREQVHIDLPVPGATWGGALIARVQVVDQKTARAVTEHQSDDGLAETADIIAAAVKELLLRDDDGTLTPLLDDDGVPLRFDHRFGPALGADDHADARTAVFLAFSEGTPPTVNVLALGTFVERISRWISDTSAEIEGAVAEGR